MSPRVKLLVSSPPTYRKPNSVEGQGPSSNQYTVKDLCKDQQGSRRIQTFLTTAKESEISEIFEAISNKKDLLSIISDLFGNYVIQKFIEYGNEGVKQTIRDVIAGRIKTLSEHMYGCRVIQKIIDYSNDEKNKMMFDEISECLEELIDDSNGNHVIQKFVEVYSECNMTVMETMNGSVMDYSIHSFGCRVIQRLIEKKNNEINSMIFGELEGNIEELAMNQFGNYVIQHLMEYASDEIRTKIIEEVLSVFCQCSLLKFASNVMEKCVEHAPKKELVKIENIIFNENAEIINKMMKDPFGNYVLQRLFNMMEKSKLREFYNKFIAKNQAPLRKNIYSKHLLSTIDSLLNN